MSQDSKTIDLYRIGDFLEAFDRDAKKVAALIGLTLNHRRRRSAEPLALAGIPCHTADRYIAKLESFGFRVTIREKLPDVLMKEFGFHMEA